MVFVGCEERCARVYYPPTETCESDDRVTDTVSYKQSQADHQTARPFSVAVLSVRRSQDACGGGGAWGAITAESELFMPQALKMNQANKANRRVSVPVPSSSVNAGANASLK